MPILKKGLLRFVWVSLLLILPFSACAPAVNPACPNNIKIGVTFTMDDLNAKSEQEEGYRLALGEVNQEGIAEGCKVELIYPKNQKSQAADVQKDVQDLVDQGALAILAAQTNDGAQRIAQVSKYFNIPVVIPADTGDEIVDVSENAWYFRINPKNSDYAVAAFNQLKFNKPVGSITCGDSV